MVPIEPHPQVVNLEQPIPELPAAARIPPVMEEDDENIEIIVD